MFNINKKSLVLFFVGFISFYVSYAQNNNDLSLKEIDNKIKDVEGTGTVTIAFLEKIKKQLPYITSELLKLKGNKAIESQLLGIFLKLYGKTLKLSDLKDFSILKNNKEIGDKLALVGTHVTIDCIFISLAYNLENKKVYMPIPNSADYEKKAEKISKLNSLVDSYQEQIGNLIETIRKDLLQILKDKFKVIINITSSSKKSVHPEVKKILQDLRYDELRNFFRIEQERFAEQLVDSIESIFNQYLDPKDLATLSKITTSNAFVKIRNVTTKGNLAQIITCTQVFLPKSAQTLTNESFEILQIKFN